MADFNQAIGIILHHEGGWVNNKNDPGGATNYGISLRFLLQELKDDPFMDFDVDHDGDVDAEDVRQMSKEMAIEIYRHAFWDAFGYSKVLDQTVGTKIFDMCVNMGSRQAHKIVQRALGITDDGILGPGTLGSINKSDPGTLLKRVCNEQAAFYLNLIARKPNLAEFRKGWLYRAAWPYQK